jgi:5'-nucleotidase
MTRYGRVSVQERPEFGVEAYALGGTPSDCVNIAVHHLLSRPPDWIVSGINIGINAGEAYVINSGTVGAAIEGALLGFPAAAFSQFVPRALFLQWATRKRFDDPAAEVMVQRAASTTARMLRTIAARGMPDGAMVLNVNFPHPLGDDTPVRWAPLLVTRYGSIFQREGDGFVHRFGGDIWREPSAVGDRDIVERGEISITALSLPGLTHPTAGYPIP